MVSHRKTKNVKSVHGIINPQCLKALAKLPGVKKVIPGIINWRKKTSAVEAGLYFQRETETGLKMAIKGNMYVQDVYVITDKVLFQRGLLRKTVLNPEKI